MKAYPIIYMELCIKGDSYMKKETLIKSAIVLCVITLLYCWCGRMGPDDSDVHGIRGTWKYQSGWDEYEEEMYLTIKENVDGEKYNLAIREDISGESTFFGYIVVADSWEECTVYRKADKEIDVSNPWDRMESVQTFSYKRKYKRFSNDELIISYVEGNEKVKLVFEKQN